MDTIEALTAIANWLNLLKNDVPEDVLPPNVILFLAIAVNILRYYLFIVASKRKHQNKRKLKMRKHKYYERAVEISQELSPKYIFSPHVVFLQQH